MLEAFKKNWKVKAGVSVGIGILVQILNGSIDIGMLFIPAFVYGLWSIIDGIRS